jgi:hypothetical protein
MLSPHRWAFVELLPVIAFIVLGCVYVVVLAYKRVWLNSRKKGDLHGHLPQVRAWKQRLWWEGLALHLSLSRLRLRACSLSPSRSSCSESCTSTLRACLSTSFRACQPPHRVRPWPLLSLSHSMAS